jgi:hypothetical protein
MTSLLVEAGWPTYAPVPSPLGGLFDTVPMDSRLCYPDRAGDSVPV